MPVKRITAGHAKQHDDLVELLAQEWRSPDASTQQPVILEESVSRTQMVRIFVVWDRWADLDRQKRAEIIMDAAEKVKLPSEVNKISIAMGLTAPEADRLAIDWKS